MTNKTATDPQTIAADLYPHLVTATMETSLEYALEVALAPWLEAMQQQHRQGNRDEADAMCMGILLALYRFDTQAVKPSNTLSSDAVVTLAEEVVFLWKAKATRGDMAAMIGFIDAAIGAWGARLV